VTHVSDDGRLERLLIRCKQNWES